MKTTIWIILLLIFWNGCATKPVVPQKPIVYSTGDTGVYLSMRYGKGKEINVTYTMDTVARRTVYYLDYSYSAKGFFSTEVIYTTLDRVYKAESNKTFKYRLENGNVFLEDGYLPSYSSEDFMKEYAKFEDFFALLSPNFKNMNNAERVKVLDSLAQIDW